MIALAQQTPDRVIFQTFMRISFQCHPYRDKYFLEMTLSELFNFCECLVCPTFEPLLLSAGKRAKT